MRLLGGPCGFSPILADVRADPTSLKADKTQLKHPPNLLANTAQLSFHSGGPGNSQVSMKGRSTLLSEHW